MPNPFPGMDPYLEGDLWTTVHTDLCSEIARQLAPKLRPKYFPFTRSRLVNASPDKTIVPMDSQQSSSSGAHITHRSVEIQDVSAKRVVTYIEVLTPTNKRGPSRKEYLTKWHCVLSSNSHLVQIDLLRVGDRIPKHKKLSNAPYYAFLSRVGHRPKLQVWPIALEQPLPEVPVPLLESDPDVKLDLQLALSTVYDIFGYDESLDYSQPPPGPLTPDQAKWVEERLREAGRRE